MRPSGVEAATRGSWSFHSASASLVLTTPGATALTRTIGDNSSASCLVRWISAAFDALYTPMFASNFMPPIDAVLTMLPP